jgi:selenoprotein W-related protein
MTQVEIEYCVPCGLLERAEDVQHALLSEYGQRLDAVTLQTGDDGVFEVRVDGEDVYDKEDDEFDVEQISERVGDRL